MNEILFSRNVNCFSIVYLQAKANEEDEESNVYDIDRIYWDVDGNLRYGSYTDQELKQ